MPPKTEIASDLRHPGRRGSDASVYKSIVGLSIYLAQERLDNSFVVKELAGRMANPTELSMQKIRKLVGYLFPFEVRTTWARP